MPETKPMQTPEERAERIIKGEGLTFALASLPPQKELAAAREILKQAIVREIRAALRAAGR